jgi:TorA maturation chaperone TorD
MIIDNENSKLESIEGFQARKPPEPPEPIAVPETPELLEMIEAIASTGQILGMLFVQNPQEPELQLLLNELRALPSFDEWPFGAEGELDEAYRLIEAGLAEVPDATVLRNPLAREYQRLFIGPHHFNAPAWGSVYLDRESVLFGCSTLELRQWMRENGIAVSSEKREPEDHIGRMLLLLAWLAQEKPELIGEFLREHLMPWAPRYFELLEEDARQSFYQGLAVLSRTTLADMTDTLGIQAVKKKLYF